MLIYRLLEKKLSVLYKYINKNLKKGFIRLLESLAGFPILFILKKNRKLRLDITFRKLNNIIVKN